MSAVDEAIPCRHMLQIYGPCRDCITAALDAAEARGYARGVREAAEMADAWSWPISIGNGTVARQIRALLPKEST